MDSADETHKRFIEAVARVIKQYRPYQERKTYDIQGTKADHAIADKLHYDPSHMPLLGDFYD